MKVSWNEHYTMGIPEIDEDHKHLFRIAEKLVNTVESPKGMNEWSRMFVVREGVKYLKNYFIEHASREEAYMRQIGYTDYVPHKRLHDEFQYVQIARFEKIIERGNCSRNEVFDFVGTGIGWLLEHISTADMAIVGKGVLCSPRAEELNAKVLEREVNMLFTATLNLNLNARIVNPNYGGEPFGDALAQQYIYQKDQQKIYIYSGIEKSFLVGAAKMVYGEELGESEGLILSTLEVFGANFWRTLGERLIQNNSDKIIYKENHYLSGKELHKIYAEKIPAVSVLFDSDMGKFFIASEDERWNQRFHKQPGA